MTRGLFVGSQQLFSYSTVSTDHALQHNYTSPYIYSIHTKTPLFSINLLVQLVPVAARSKERVCGRSLFGILGLNSAGVRMSGRGLVDGLITCPKESYRVWCV